MLNIIIIIPAYNEEKAILSVIKKTKENYSNIIVIDDGSEDNTAEIARREGVKVFRHFINRGVGAATGTGLKAALNENADIAVLLDADNQHDPNMIPHLIQPLLNNSADIVIGSRFLNPQKIPFLRKIYNKIANLVTYILFGIKTTDSQSGMRAFNKKALESIDIKSNGPEVCSEIIKEISNKKLRLAEIPIKAIYTQYSLSKGQNLYLGIKTFFKLIIIKITK